MILTDAFILDSAVSYLACTVFSFLGRPAMDDMTAARQGLAYACLFCLLVLSLRISILNLPLGFIYCFAAVGSFMGWPQIWMSYWKVDPNAGSGVQQVGMAAWDLLLAVAFFMKAG